jgi:hypothetical protein
MFVATTCSIVWIIFDYSLLIFCVKDICTDESSLLKFPIIIESEPLCTFIFNGVYFMKLGEPILVHITL